MARRVRAFMLAVSFGLAWVGVPHGVQAEAHDAEHEEQAGAEGGEHHGHLSLREVLAGHDAIQFWGAVVNFALLLWVLRRLGKKPLDSFLTGRRDAIERGILEATEVKRAAQAVYDEYTERLKTLDQELAKLRSEITLAAERDKARIVEEAQATISRLKADTASMITRQTEQLQADIQREVVAAAIAAAEQAVRQSTTQDDQRRLADSFARELGQPSGERVA